MKYYYLGIIVVEILLSMIKKYVYILWFWFYDKLDLWLDICYFCIILINIIGK